MGRMAITYSISWTGDEHINRLTEVQSYRIERDRDCLNLKDLDKAVVRSQHDVCMVDEELTFTVILNAIVRVSNVAWKTDIFGNTCASCFSSISADGFNSSSSLGSVPGEEGWDVAVSISLEKLDPVGRMPLQQQS